MPKVKSKSTNSESAQVDEKEKIIGLFDVLNMIDGPRTPWAELSDDYKKAYSQFMINRFVSSIELYVPIVAKLSETKGLTDEQHYFILTNTIDPHRKHWFNYKTYKKEKTEKDQLLLEYAVCREYEIGRREAKMYINNLAEVVKDKLRTKWEEVYKNEVI